MPTHAWRLRALQLVQLERQRDPTASAEECAGRAAGKMSCIMCKEKYTRENPVLGKGCACPSSDQIMCVQCVLAFTRRDPKYWHECQGCRQQYAGEMKAALEAQDTFVAAAAAVGQPGPKPSSSGFSFTAPEAGEKPAFSFSAPATAVPSSGGGAPTFSFSGGGAPPSAAGAGRQFKFGAAGAAPEPAPEPEPEPEPAPEPELAAVAAVAAAAAAAAEAEAARARRFGGYRPISRKPWYQQDFDCQYGCDSGHHPRNLCCSSMCRRRLCHHTSADDSCRCFPSNHAAYFADHRRARASQGQARAGRVGDARRPRHAGRVRGRAGGAGLGWLFC